MPSIQPWGVARACGRRPDRNCAMQVELQTETIAFLTDPATHAASMGPSAGAVEVIETHISVVVLAGDACLQAQARGQVALCRFLDGRAAPGACASARSKFNRRAVPDLYLGVKRITRTADGTPRLRRRRAAGRCRGRDGALRPGRPVRPHGAARCADPGAAGRACRGRRPPARGGAGGTCRRRRRQHRRRARHQRAGAGRQRAVCRR